MKNKRKIILLVLIAGILLFSGCLIWNHFASTTRIALVNFQPFQVSNIALSNTDHFVKFTEIPLEELDELEDYDFVLVFGIGLKMNEEQREELIWMSGKVPLHVFAATTPENNISSLDKDQLEKVMAYLESGNKQNYQSLGRYIRKYVDKKLFFISEPGKVTAAQEDVYFHLDEKLAFSDIGSYESYLKKNNLYREGKPKVALIAGIHDPFGGNRQHLDSIIVSLQNSGLNVYPVSSFSKRIEFLDEINPDAVIYFPHGRLLMADPDRTVEWMKQHNVPFFTPLSVLELEEDWLKNPMGMFGGFMGQCIVMPELDGAVYSYVIATQDKNQDGIYVFKTLPERLKKFTRIINNFISLKSKSNREKKVAIYYFKGQGNNTLNAQGLEAVSSLYKVLKRMKSEGYKIDGLPATEQAFTQMLHEQGSIYSPSEKGAFEEFLKNGNPALIEVSLYDSWLRKSLTRESYNEVIGRYGKSPGMFMNTENNGKAYLAVSRVQFGNVVLLPQPAAAIGSDEFKITHGVKEPPPHPYLGSYLWMQHEFKADAVVHFGTHGSLEFTPEKQVALSGNDWGDVLIGTVPHFYYYTIGNIGESMMAKRRSYATTISYLTPAFVESDMRDHFNELQNKIKEYYKADDNLKNKVSLEVKKIAVGMGMHRDLRLDSILTKPYSEPEIAKLANFAEEISSEKINAEYYTTGKPYTPEKINSTVLAMSVDPLAYSIAVMDKQKGKLNDAQLKNNVFFTKNYLNPAKILVQQILNGKEVSPELVCSLAGISLDELEKAKIMLTPPKVRPPFGKKPSVEKKRTVTPEDKERARAILEIERTLNNVILYKENLISSPEMELKSFLNALSGGYIAPSSGGDAVANPYAVPTGHNLYSINAEATPSELAWDRGVKLAQSTLDEYKSKHGKYPEKICYTFWSSEFIETEGVSIAQVFYMLGVEPVRDTYGRVIDVRLIPSRELGRPRIDVVIQTSGQFRDLAASRLFLITKAIGLAASTKDDIHENLVKQGNIDIERQLVSTGIPPKIAREMAGQRIFGGLQGRYDTGIKELITAGDKWNTRADIAEVYIHNMGAIYGDEKKWGQYEKGMLRAALQNTDILIQPRQNNTWGALSLDHVYEFMGGMNTAIKEVTGKDPDAYLADYRNHNRMKMQEIKEAVGVEARATVFNPKYIREMMNGKASSAGRITEVVTNMYGWNSTRPEVIEDQMWNQLYDTYIRDKENLGVKGFFLKENPAALQEITAVMLETSRKGMWKASPDQLKELAGIHMELVKEIGTQSSGFALNNEKLQDFIVKNISASEAKIYQEKLREMKEGKGAKSVKEGKVLKKEEVHSTQAKQKLSLDGKWIAAAALALFAGLVFFLRRRRNRNR